jgi:RND family efflux transporter MFP subunit
MKKKLIYVIPLIIIIFVAGGAFYYFNRAQNPTFSFVTAKNQDLKEEIETPGTVKAAEDVQLGFEKSGKVEKILVKVNDKVKAGDVLARQSSSDLSAQMASAQAAVQSAQAMVQNAQAAFDLQAAKLADLKVGARAEDLNSSQIKIDNAKKTIADAQINLNNVQSKATVDLENNYLKAKDALSNAYLQSDDAINNKIYNLFTSDVNNQKINFLNSDTQLQGNVENERLIINGDLNAMQTTVNGLGDNHNDIDVAIIKVKGELENEKKLLSDLNSLLDVSIGIDALKSSYKINVNAALSNINSAITLLNNQAQAITAQKSLNNNLIAAAQAQINQANNTLASAQGDYVLKKSGASEDQIEAQAAAVAQAHAGVSSQQALVAQAEAGLENLAAQMQKTVLTAPMDGVITQQDGKEGEIVSPGVPFITIMSNARYQIETYIQEAKIGKIKINQIASVTLDAYGNDQKFAAKVIAIDPANTIVNGISAYKITLEFIKDNNQIKSGLSAEVDIVIAENKNALVVPASSIIKNNNQNYVIIDNGTPAGEQRQVEIGLTGSDGNVEIISGVKVGEKVAGFGK